MSSLDQARDTQLKNIETKTGRTLAQLRTLLTGRGLQPENVGDSWLNQTYRQVVQGKWR